MAYTKLFIAEKPSLAQAIVRELGAVKREDGFTVCRGDVAVTWCFGHLLEQAEPDAYLPDDVPKTKKGTKIWRMEDLPIFPREWKAEAKAQKGVKGQLSTIGKLIRGSKSIVNAGDPDREGQLLVDEVLEHFKCTKPVERFWVSAVDPVSIQRGLESLQPNTKFAGMRDAARGRSRADWLLGMNLSRAYTLTNRGEDGRSSLIAVGRVQTPTLMMVAGRDFAVKNFEPKPFLAISAKLKAQGNQFTARWKPKDGQPGMDEEGKLLLDVALGKKLVQRLSGTPKAQVISAETKHKKANQPKGYSLADIQIEASRRFGFTAEDTLRHCQSLYETHKITSYPRTDCAYLPEAQHPDAKNVLRSIGQTMPELKLLCDGADPSIKSPTFSDKKVTAHHAIVPVANAADLSKLSDGEAKIYRLLALRYIAQFYPAHEYDATEIQFDIGGETFVAKGKVVTVSGWKCVMSTDAPPAEDDEKKDQEEQDDEQALPKLVQGDSASVVGVNGREDKTKPPAYYTEGTLIAAMENIWRSFDDPKKQAVLKAAGGIGTPATRAAIIAELRRKKYLVAQGKKLHCSEEGRALLKKVSPKIRSAVLTAAFEEKLKLVEAGTYPLNDFVKEYEDFILTELEKLKAAMPDPAETPKKAKPAEEDAEEAPKPARTARRRTASRPAAPEPEDDGASDDNEEEAPSPRARFRRRG